MQNSSSAAASAARTRDSGEDTQFSRGNNAQLWTFSTDLKLNVPLGHTFGMTPKLALYGIGGWTYTWFKDLPARLSIDNNIINNVNTNAFVLGDSSWTGRNGWDAGGGLSLLWGRSEVFVESRSARLHDATLFTGSSDSDRIRVQLVLTSSTTKGTRSAAFASRSPTGSRGATRYSLRTPNLHYRPAEAGP